jgi:hypothetical protein
MNHGYKLRAFTFPEALATISLMLLFTSLLGGLFYQGQTLARQRAKHAMQIQEKISLATYFPSLCESIRPPIWMSQEQVFTIENGKFNVRYWDSDPAKSLSIEIFDGTIRVTTPDGTWQWRTLQEPAVHWWIVSDRIVGLQLMWTESGETKTFNLPWGSRVL